MIIKLDTPDKIMLLLKVEDTVEEMYKCSRGEWIQFLISIIQSPNIMILASVDKDNIINSYTIVQNAIAPPLSNSVHIIYAFSSNNKDNIEIFNTIKNWALSLGAKKITATSKLNVLDKIKKYGFIETDYRILEFEL